MRLQLSLLPCSLLLAACTQPAVIGKTDARAVDAGAGREAGGPDSATADARSSGDAEAGLRDAGAAEAHALDATAADAGARSLCGGSTCSSGLSCCGGTCVDRTIDGRNCGTCGTACSAGLVCSGGACIALPDVPSARGGLAAAAAPSGEIYVLGGGATASGGCPSAEVDVYSPSTNTWKAGPPLPTPRFYLAAATGSDGRIYAIGGTDGCVAMSTVEAYSSSTGAWSTVAPLPVAACGLAAVAWRNGLIYAIGGGLPFPSITTYASVQAYSPATNAWTAAPSLATPREFPGAAVGTDGRIYVAGGVSSGASSVNFLSSVEALGPGATGWTAVAAMPTARAGLALEPGPDGRLYAVGGNASGPALTTVEAYLPGGSWSAAPSLPAALTAFGSTAGLAPHALIFVFSGYHGGTVASAAYSPATYAFSTSSQSW